MIEIPPDVAEFCRNARDVVVLSGAGISAESGVPTFREVQTGLWERFDAQQLATIEAWENDPELVWSWYVWRALLVRGVAPNDGHRALAEWANRARVRIVTQNVDDLHERAGSAVLAHVHGSLFAFRCSDCGLAYDTEQALANPPGLDAAGEPDTPAAPPRCAACNAMVRPGVVWFGERLPEGAMEAAAEAVATADLVLVVGTSGLVYPAAGLPGFAVARGVPVIEVNPEETALSDVVGYSLRGPSATVLPQLAALVGGGAGRAS